MPLKKYGVLVGRAITGTREDDESSPHYQIRVRAGGSAVSTLKCNGWIGWFDAG